MLSYPLLLGIMAQEMSRKRKADYQIAGIPKKVINEWNVSDVGAFLEVTGLTEHKDTFAEEGIDGPLLRTLNEIELDALGIRSLGSRMKLANALKILDAAEVEASAENEDEENEQDGANSAQRVTRTSQGSSHWLIFLLACGVAAYFGLISCTAVSSLGTNSSFYLDAVAFAWTYFVVSQWVTLGKSLRNGHVGWALVKAAVVFSLFFYAENASVGSIYNGNYRTPVGVPGRPETVLNYLFSPPVQLRALEIGTVCAPLPNLRVFRIGASLLTFDRVEGCQMRLIADSNLVAGSNLGAALRSALQEALSHTSSGWKI
jgi:hypothetical protein